MVKKDSLEDFINKAKLIHKNTYDYSLSQYTNSRTKIKIKCNTCKIIFEQTPSHHLISKKCINCLENNKLTNFIKKSRELYGENTFDYSFVKTVSGANIKVTLVCKNCNLKYEQFINNHLQGTFGCNLCWKLSKRLSCDEFIHKSKEIHGDTFDYTQVEYINSITKVKIKCNTCKTIFEQTPGGHLYHEHKCLTCTHNNQRKTNTEFIKEAIEIHGNKYDYNLVKYINAYTHVKIYCNICKNIFEQKPRNHTHLSNGCPYCNFSKGESKCKIVLDNNINVKNIIPQYKFKDCKNIKCLPFDFKVILTNKQFFLIEFQGRQHYEENSYFKSNTLEEQQMRDVIKYNYCKNNNIPLLIIKYTEFDNIEFIINNFILICILNSAP